MSLYSPQARNGDNLSVHQPMNEQRECNTYTQLNTTQSLKTEWNPVICNNVDKTGHHYVNKINQEQKDKYYMFSFGHELQKSWSHKT
jgi:hypothetical protein